MIDTQKANFKAMMKALTSLYGKQEMETELLRIWWSKLEKYDFDIVSHALDKWTDENKRMPTPADIIELCKAQLYRHQFVKLPSPKVEYDVVAKHIAEIHKLLDAKKI